MMAQEIQQTQIAQQTQQARLLTVIDKVKEFTTVVRVPPGASMTVGALILYHLPYIKKEAATSMSYYYLTILDTDGKDLTNLLCSRFTGSKIFIMKLETKEIAFRDSRSFEEVSIPVREGEDLRDALRAHFAIELGGAPETIINTARSFTCKLVKRLIRVYRSDSHEFMGEIQVTREDRTVREYAEIAAPIKSGSIVLDKYDNDISIIPVKQFPGNEIWVKEGI